MKKLILLMCVAIGAFAANSKYYDSDYKIKCIEGHKWIIFYNQRGLSMDYFQEQPAVQVFKVNSSGGASVPIKCDGTEEK